MIPSVKRGDIYYADLSPVVGSEQGGLRPVLVVQNDVGNKYSPTVIVAAITSRIGKTKLPTHIEIYAKRAGLFRDSVVLLEQIRTLDKQRLRDRLGHLDTEIMNEIDNAIAVSLGLLPHGATLPAHTAAPRHTAPGQTGASAPERNTPLPGGYPAHRPAAGGRPSFTDPGRERMPGGPIRTYPGHPAYAPPAAAASVAAPSHEEPDGEEKRGGAIG